MIARDLAILHLDGTMISDGGTGPAVCRTHEPGPALTCDGVAFPLFDAPAGKQLGELNVDFGLNVRVLAHRKGWLRIATAERSFGRSEEPYEFDAWIAEGFERPADSIGIYFGEEARTPTGHAFDVVVVGPRTPPSHLTIASLPVRLLPDPSAPVVSSLSIDVPLLAGEERAGMRRIHLDGAHGNNEGSDFWVTTAELNTSATSWSASASRLKKK
ncbi:MAG: hypothetical protein ABUL60_32335 [Myxococcales bacterium]